MSIIDRVDHLAGTTLSRRAPTASGRHARGRRPGMKPVSEWVTLPERQGRGVHARTVRLPQVGGAA